MTHPALEKLAHVTIGGHGESRTLKELYSEQFAELERLLSPTPPRAPEMIVDYGPDTPAERQAKEVLLQLQQEYLKRAEPWNRVLARGHALKMPRRVILVDTPSK